MTPALHAGNRGFDPHREHFYAIYIFVLLLISATVFVFFVYVFINTY